MNAVGKASTTNSSDAVRADPVELRPQLGSSTPIFFKFCERLAEQIQALEGENLLGLVERHRNELVPIGLVSEAELSLVFSKSVILDFVAQGWIPQVSDSLLLLCPPGITGETKDVAKEIIRRSHLVGRDTQLRERAVRDFVLGMERRRLTLTGWHSIFSLMRDGRDLAAKLQTIKALDGDREKLEALAGTISPYLQFVEPGAICEHTGLRLGDIWRYFRHTWVNEYKSVPGRSIMILIRDEAAPNHPVIGIAALGSSVVQHKVRDKWIGWHPESFVNEFSENLSMDRVKWLTTSLNRLIKDIYIDDLIEDGILSRGDLKTPSKHLIARLFEESLEAIQAHRKEPQRLKHASQKSESLTAAFWAKEARTFLYRSKRCKQLAKLLNARLVLRENRIRRGTSEQNLRRALGHTSVKSAIALVARMVKGEHVGIDMMDITVCGAIAPYNLLLGGKLVCLLLCSPEVPLYYSKRYARQASIIASAMKGRPVYRRPNLVLLGTTSLYSVGSSQYNRVKLPLEEVGGTSSGSIAYENLGYSEGFGTYQFSADTIRLGSVLNSRKKDGRRVNSIFGEGVNPLMRKIRESLDCVGLNSEGLLQHGNHRVTYGVKLASNFREVLIGVEKNPEYLIPLTNANAQTSKIADYWRRRWLLRRIENPEIISAVSNHLSSDFPPSHGAMVPVPSDYEDSQD